MDIRRRGKCLVVETDLIERVCPHRRQAADGGGTGLRGMKRQSNGVRSAVCAGMDNYLLSAGRVPNRSPGYALALFHRLQQSLAG